MTRPRYHAGVFIIGQLMRQLVERFESGLITLDEALMEIQAVVDHLDQLVQQAFALPPDAPWIDDAVRGARLRQALIPTRHKGPAGRRLTAGSQ